jgi:hypothetical protein
MHLDTLDDGTDARIKDVGVSPEADSAGIQPEKA